VGRVEMKILGRGRTGFIPGGEGCRKSWKKIRGGRDQLIVEL